MSGKSEYEDVEVLRDADGVVAVISERKNGTGCAVAIFKEFTRDGKTQRSAFLQRRHIAAAKRLLEIAEEKMDELGDRKMAAQRAQVVR